MTPFNREFHLGVDDDIHKRDAEKADRYDVLSRALHAIVAEMNERVASTDVDPYTSNEIERWADKLAALVPEPERKK
jgi:hypothetical protein